MKHKHTSHCDWTRNLFHAWGLLGKHLKIYYSMEMLKGGNVFE